MIRPIGSPTANSSSSSSSAASPAPDQPSTSAQAVDSFAAAQASVRSAMASFPRPSQSRRRPGGDDGAQGSAPRRARMAEPQAQDAAYTAAENRLHTVLRTRQIECKPTLIELIHNRCPADRKVRLMEKSAHFFYHADRAQIADTSVLTSMLFGGSRSRWALIEKIDGFINSNDDFIAFVANSRCLKSIAAMHHGVGFPSYEDTQNFLSLSLLETYGMAVVTALSSMCTGKRFPSRAAVNELLGAGAIHQADGHIDESTLKSIAHMCHNKGIPSGAAVTNLLSLPCLRDRDSIDSFVLHKITAMCSGCGIPNQESVETIMALISQHSNNERDLQRRLLRCFADLYFRRGIPSSEEINQVLGLANLRVGDQLNIVLLEAVARANKGACIPRPDMVEQARRTLDRSDSVASASTGSVPSTSQPGSHSGVLLHSMLGSSSWQYLRSQEGASASSPTAPATAEQGTLPHSPDQPSTSTSLGYQQGFSTQMFGPDFSIEDALEQAQDSVTSINVALLGSLEDSQASSSTGQGAAAQSSGLLSLEEEFAMIEEIISADGFDEADNH